MFTVISQEKINNLSNLTLKRCQFMVHGYTRYQWQVSMAKQSIDISHSQSSVNLPIVSFSVLIWSSRNTCFSSLKALRDDQSNAPLRWMEWVDYFFQLSVQRNISASASHIFRGNLFWTWRNDGWIYRDIIRWVARVSFIFVLFFRAVSYLLVSTWRVRDLPFTFEHGLVPQAAASDNTTRFILKLQQKVTCLYRTRYNFPPRFDLKNYILMT